MRGRSGARRAGHPYRLCGPTGSRASEHKKRLSDLQDWPEGRCLPRPRRCLGSVNAVPVPRSHRIRLVPSQTQTALFARDSQGSAHGLQLSRGGVLPWAWTMANGPATKPCGPSSMPSRVPCGRGARGTITEPSKRGLIGAGRAIQCWGGHRRAGKKGQLGCQAGGVARDRPHHRRADATCGGHGKPAIKIDTGLQTPAVCGDGKYTTIRKLTRALIRLRRANKALARKRKGSAHGHK